MVFSTSDKPGAAMQRSLNSTPRLNGSARGTPLGPRKAPDKPTRHHTIDASSLSTSSTVRSASNANKSQTEGARDVRECPSPAAAGPSTVYSASQPSDSPLSTVSDTHFPSVSHSGSSGSMSLLSSRSHSHVPGMTLPARLGPGRSPHQFRKVSGASTDGNLSDAGAHLDFKRLMSKPAVHTTSGSSIISLFSDSELSTSSRQFAQATALSFGLHPGQQDRLAFRPQSRNSVSPNNSPSREPPRSSSRTSQAMSPPQVKEPPRKPNVLRRRPSTVDTLNTTSRTFHPRRKMRSIDGLRSLATETSAVQPGTSRKNMPSSASALTPASQVALAYKQQELRRSALEQMSGYNDDVGPELGEASSSANMERREVRRGVSLEVAEEEETTGPYYTVFGSGTGQVVAARSAFVGDLDSPARVPVDKAGGEHVKKSKRTLSRKMSGSFKKVADIVKGDREHLGHSREDSWRPYGAKPPRSPRPPSILDGHGSSPNSPTHPSIRTARNSPPSSHSPRSLQDKEWPTGHDKSLDTGAVRAGPSRLGHNKGMQSEREDEGADEGKWWKLVKRISTGGLRDKYRERPRTSTPPPVPPLPLDMQKLAEYRSTFDIGPSPKEGVTDDLPFPKPISVQARSSGSGRPSTASSQKRSSRHTIASRPSSASKHSSSPSVQRPGTATRSSSPISSEPASSGFFPKTHSTRSSTSSYGEHVPPLPVTQASTVGQHIVAPSELGRLDTSRVASKVSSKRKPVRSASEPKVETEPYASSGDEKPQSLRPPPRRSGTPLRDTSSQERSASPTLPSFSTEGCVNNFSPAPISPSTLPLPEFGPPPRPARSSRRKPASIEVPSLAAFANAPQSARLPSTPRTPRPLVKTSLGRFASGRESTITVNASDSIKRSAPSVSSSPVSSSTSPSSSSSLRSPPLFRELESSRQAWTEQEKQDKWEALLERSARAGGTLHIGETGLLSDSMHMSNFGL
ncbi:uncharacterized protein B0H18DRAFT_1115472 [Fomitopsis serialis]|uniref:uncharacterized protein n=1 Tax=Fomitopsis serialis TaxID=139415 RepID=UPI00200721C6|nr:uncharacterized protein B0H18DRAFT_1115472 [Neoantrodia serialis]KAH9933481.1 hypothetical protein B0H18DRAFT_1115472 [Neoantrodia serialis]